MTGKKKKKTIHVRAGATQRLALRGKGTKQTVKRVRVLGVESSSTGLRAYVNLDRDDSKLPHVFKVRAKLGAMPPGKKVYFALETKGESIDDPLAAGEFVLPMVNRASLGATADGAMEGVAFFTETDAKRKGSPRGLCFVRFSTFGGTQARVGATTDRKTWERYQEDPAANVGSLVWTDWITSWRRINYSAGVMEKSDGGDYQDDFELIKGPWHTQLEKAFVELNEITLTTVPFQMAVFASKEEVIAFGREHAPNLLRGPHVRVFLVDLVHRDDAKTGTASFDPPTDSANWEALLPHSSGTDRLRSEVHVELKTVKISGSPIADAKLSVRGDRYVISADLSSVDVVVRHMGPIKVEYTYWETGLAAAAEDTCVIGTQWRHITYAGKPALLKRSLLKSLVHEVGHILGVAAFHLPDFNKTKLFTLGRNGKRSGKSLGSHAMPTHYYNGYHCKRNYDETKGTACVMFHSGFMVSGDVPKGELCDVCVTALRGRVLTSTFNRAGVSALDTDHEGYDPKR